MINLPLNILKESAKSISIKDYKNKSKDYFTKNTKRMTIKNNPLKNKIEDIHAN